MPSALRDPSERTFWIEAGRLLGGPYPGDPDPRVARAKLSALLDRGMRAFVSLMEPDERGHGGVPFVPYQPLAASLATERGLDVAFARFPVVDQSVPTLERMREILTFIDERLACGEPCYVHCWGGRGRTGTVAGVHLIRRGVATPDDFVAVIRALRVADPDPRQAPENEEQRKFVRGWGRRSPS